MLNLRPDATRTNRHSRSPVFRLAGSALVTILVCLAYLRDDNRDDDLAKAEKTHAFAQNVAAAPAAGGDKRVNSLDTPLTESQKALVKSFEQKFSLYRQALFDYRAMVAKVNDPKLHLEEVNARAIPFRVAANAMLETLSVSDRDYLSTPSDAHEKFAKCQRQFLEPISYLADLRSKEELGVVAGLATDQWFTDSLKEKLAEGHRYDEALARMKQPEDLFPLIESLESELKTEYENQVKAIGMPESIRHYQEALFRADHAGDLWLAYKTYLSHDVGRAVEPLYLKRVALHDVINALPDSEERVRLATALADFDASFPLRLD